MSKVTLEYEKLFSVYMTRLLTEDANKKLDTVQSCSLKQGIINSKEFSRYK